MFWISIGFQANVENHVTKSMNCKDNTLQKDKSTCKKKSIPCVPTRIKSFKWVSVGHNFSQSQEEVWKKIRSKSILVINEKLEKSTDKQKSVLVLMERGIQEAIVISMTTNLQEARELVSVQGHKLKYNYWIMLIFGYVFKNLILQVFFKQYVQIHYSSKVK